MSEAELARLRGPVGLDLGGRAPAETALAILAEIVAERYGGSGRADARAGARDRLTRGPQGESATPARAAGRRARVTRSGPRWEDAAVNETTVGLVLAAGAASRFGGGKLLATIGGRPMLQHVLDAMAEAGVGEVVVVLGDDAAAIEGAIAWRGERRVVNPDPDAGWRARCRSGSRRCRRRPRPCSSPSATSRSSPPR